MLRIFYKSSQTCGMHINGDRYLGTEEVQGKSMVRMTGWLICYTAMNQ
jgi:hypothetical protein